MTLEKGDIKRQWCRVCNAHVDVRKCIGREVNPGRWALFSCPFPHIPIGASDDEIRERLIHRKHT